MVERGNRRVQVFSLPSFESLGYMANGELEFPYGLTVFASAPETYELYLTDNYGEGAVLGPAHLSRRVKHYRFWLHGKALSSTLVRHIGATQGDGALREVESIYADPEYGRLMIADEDGLEKRIKVYDLDGNYTDRLVGSGLFSWCFVREVLLTLPCSPRKHDFT